MPATIHPLPPRGPGTHLRKCPGCGLRLRPRRKRREPGTRDLTLVKGFPFILPRQEPYFALGPRPWIIQVNPHGNPDGPSHQWMESLASRLDGFTAFEARERLSRLSGAMGLVYRAFNVKTHESFPWRVPAPGAGAP